MLSLREGRVTFVFFFSFYFLYSSLFFTLSSHLSLLTSLLSSISTSSSYYFSIIPFTLSTKPPNPYFSILHDILGMQGFCSESHPLDHRHIPTGDLPDKLHVRLIEHDVEMLQTRDSFECCPVSKPHQLDTVNPVFVLRADDLTLSDGTCANLRWT